MAQKVPPKNLPVDVTAKYLTSPALAADWVAHAKCMAQRDPNARNLCFGPTHHKYFTDCQKIIADNRFPQTAVCAEGKIIGKDFRGGQ